MSDVAVVMDLSGMAALLVPFELQLTRAVRAASVQQIALTAVFGLRALLLVLIARLSGRWIVGWSTAVRVEHSGRPNWAPAAVVTGKRLVRVVRCFGQLAS